MCETCGVTREQYEQAARLLHHWCAAQDCLKRGVDPAGLRDHRGQPLQIPSRHELAALNERVTIWHAAHPGKGMNRQQMLEWMDGWFRRTGVDADRRAAFRAKWGTIEPSACETRDASTRQLKG